MSEPGRVEVDRSRSGLLRRRTIGELGVRHGLDRTKELLALEGPNLSDLMKIRFYPCVLRRGEGCWVEDEDGNVFLDLSAGAAVMNLGYRHPAVAEAVVAAMHGPWSTTSAVVAHQAEITLAARLNALVPGDTKVWFGTSGSEALDMLARYVRSASGSDHIISFKGADHGQTAGSARISGLAFHSDVASDDVTLLPYPNPYRCAAGPCETEACSLACLDGVERALAARGRTAAVFFEPVQSNGGDIVPPRNVLPALRDLCDAAGVWLVLDEIKVGLGRTGKLFAYEHADIVPDAVALGKALGGGLPLSAVIGRGEILDVALGGCVSTLAGSPIPCAAALAVLDVLESEDLAGNARRRGEQLLAGLREVTADSQIVGDVRGLGLVLGVELVEDRLSRTHSPSAAAKVVFRCHELGALTIYTGIAGNVVELTPPLTICRDEVETAIRIVGAAIADVERGVVADEQLANYRGW